jgi:hypothetical protein
MAYSRVELAARNNAIWCDTVCRAHGIPGEFHEEMWLNRQPVPRFYSNMVTLSGQARGAQLAQLQALETQLTGPWSIKDSFACLDLAPLGFRPLFDATWLWHEPSHTFPGIHIPGVNWSRVESGRELAEWEAAWNGEPAGGYPRIFLPALLSDPDVLFIAAYQAREIAAGAIANYTDEVVGLSNIFVRAGDAAVFWEGFLNMTRELFPGLPVVGYERGPGLALAQRAGFRLLNPMRVWIRQK